MQAILPIFEENEMTKAELVAALRKSPIWAEDRWGHFQLSWKQIDYRFKVQDLSLRYEKKLGCGWVRADSDYYKNLEIVDGRLRLGSRRIPLETLPV